MPNLDYVYRNLIAGRALESVLLAPKKESSLQDRAGKIQRFFTGIQEGYFPEDLRKDLRTVRSVGIKKVPNQNLWRGNSMGAKAQSLTKGEAKKVLQAFIVLIIEVTKRLDPQSRWRKIKHGQ